MGEGHLSLVKVETCEPTQLGSESEDIIPRNKFTCRVDLVCVLGQGGYLATIWNDANPAVQLERLEWGGWSDLRVKIVEPSRSIACLTHNGSRFSILPRRGVETTRSWFFGRGGCRQFDRVKAGEVRLGDNCLPN